MQIKKDNTSDSSAVLYTSHSRLWGIGIAGQKYNDGMVTNYNPRNHQLRVKITYNL